jgi:hypothetical protein
LETICFEIESNEEVWSLIDKTIPNIFINRFNPNYMIEWWNTSVISNDGISLNNISVRNMEFDIQTDLIGLKKILELETVYLDIYQFSKPVPDTLVIEQLPKNSSESILLNNGLQHIFSIEFEVLTLESFNPEFIKAVRENPLFAERIERWRNNNIKQ